MSTTNIVVLLPTKQQLLDYANSLVTINNYAWAITNQQLPVLNSPPANYGDFTAKFTSARTHALNWSQNILVNLIQFPQTITQEAADLFSMEDLMITMYLNKLIKNPGDADSKTKLGKALTTMQTLIGIQVKSVTDAQAQLAAFDANLEDDAKTLTDIAQDALTDAGADQDKITSILSDIQTLQDEIAAANQLLTLSEIGLGVSLFIGLVGAVCCFIPGAQGVGIGLLVVGVAGEAASIAGTVIENRTISALQKEIDSDQSQISGLKQDIILLKAVSASFNNLYNANLQAQSALKTISDVWTNLGTLIQQLQTDLTTVENDAYAKNVTSQDYSDALKAMTDAEQAWNEVVAFATALANINYSWQDSSGAWHDYTVQSPQLNSGSVTTIPSTIAAAA